MEPQWNKILSEVARHLLQIGSANDAEDHNYKEDAERMRSEACASLRGLLEAHPFLVVMLPGLGAELETGHILGFGWSQLLDAVEEHLPASQE